MQSYRKALTMTQALVDREPTASHRTALAESHVLLADMFWAEARSWSPSTHYRLAVTLRERLAADDPNPATRLELPLVITVSVKRCSEWATTPGQPTPTRVPRRCSFRW
jgi:hypothetical protein